jgi:hypothetical protein
MTPLAMELIEDLYSELHMRPVEPIPGIDFMDKSQLRSVFWTCAHQCKFFDCSAITSVAASVAEKTFNAFEKHDRFDQRLAFLPAEWTWIEIENPGFRDQRPNMPANKFFVADRPWNYTYRTAFIFITYHGCTDVATRRYQISYETPRPPNSPRVWRVQNMGALPLVNSGMRPPRYKKIKLPDGRTEYLDKPTALVGDFYHYALLAFINTPRIIGQRVHQPHQRIEREKLAKLKLTGKFPLRAWTEIVLKVGLPDDRSDDPTRETHLTGERCLHFCRTYLRMRYGAIEYVEGHWRGDPALGMKRSRYRLQKEQNDSGEVGQRSVDTAPGL